MNLRVETVVAPVNRSGSLVGPGPVLGRSRRAATVQLFHLRMHNLECREFSLRRYCRDSGRQVCGCRLSPLRLGRPALRQDALPPALVFFLVCLRLGFFHTILFFSLLPEVLDARKPGDRNGAMRVRWGPRPSTESGANPPSALLVPTDTIKLDFSNYARVDVRRGSAGRYEFEWWGHGYAWKRSVDKTLDTVSFHLIRDGHGRPVAHIVPEVRSPNQVEAEDRAGGWVPPFFMWIGDPAIVEAMTDVAE